MDLFVHNPDKATVLAGVIPPFGNRILVISGFDFLRTAFWADECWGAGADAATNSLHLLVG